MDTDQATKLTFNALKPVCVQVMSLLVPSSSSSSSSVRSLPSSSSSSNNSSPSQNPTKTFVGQQSSVSKDTRSLTPVADPTNGTPSSITILQNLLRTLLCTDSILKDVHYHTYSNYSPNPSFSSSISSSVDFFQPQSTNVPSGTQTEINVSTNISPLLYRKGLPRCIDYVLIPLLMLLPIESSSSSSSSSSSRLTTSTDPNSNTLPSLSSDRTIELVLRCITVLYVATGGYHMSVELDPTSVPSSSSTTSSKPMSPSSSPSPRYIQSTRIDDILQRLVIIILDTVQQYTGMVSISGSSTNPSSLASIITTTPKLSTDRKYSEETLTAALDLFTLICTYISGLGIDRNNPDTESNILQYVLYNLKTSIETTESSLSSSGIDIYWLDKVPKLTPVQYLQFFSYSHTENDNNHKNPSPVTSSSSSYPYQRGFPYRSSTSSSSSSSLPIIFQNKGIVGTLISNLLTLLTIDQGSRSNGTTRTSSSSSNVASLSSSNTGSIASIFSRTTQLSILRTLASLLATLGTCYPNPPAQNHTITSSLSPLLVPSTAVTSSRYTFTGETIVDTQYYSSSSSSSPASTSSLTSSLLVSLLPGILTSLLRIMVPPPNLRSNTNNYIPLPNSLFYACTVYTFGLTLFLTVPDSIYNYYYRSTKDNQNNFNDNNTDQFLAPSVVSSSSVSPYSDSQWWETTGQRISQVLSIWLEHCLQQNDTFDVTESVPSLDASTLVVPFSSPPSPSPIQPLSRNTRTIHNLRRYSCYYLCTNILRYCSIISRPIRAGLIDFSFLLTDDDHSRTENISLLSQFIPKDIASEYITLSVCTALLQLPYILLGPSYYRLIHLTTEKKKTENKDTSFVYVMKEINNNNTVGPTEWNRIRSLFLSSAASTNTSTGSTATTTVSTDTLFQTLSTYIGSTTTTTTTMNPKYSSIVWDSLRSQPYNSLYLLICMIDTTVNLVIETNSSSSSSKSTNPSHLWLSSVPWVWNTLFSSSSSLASSSIGNNNESIVSILASLLLSASSIVQLSSWYLLPDTFVSLPPSIPSQRSRAISIAASTSTSSSTVPYTFPIPPLLFAADKEALYSRENEQYNRNQEGNDSSRPTAQNSTLDIVSNLTSSSSSSISSSTSYAANIQIRNLDIHLINQYQSFLHRLPFLLGLDTVKDLIHYFTQHLRTLIQPVVVSTASDVNTVSSPTKKKKKKDSLLYAVSILYLLYNLLDGVAIDYYRSMERLITLRKQYTTSIKSHHHAPDASLPSLKARMDEQYNRVASLATLCTSIVTTLFPLVTDLYKLKDTYMDQHIPYIVMDIYLGQVTRLVYSLFRLCFTKYEYYLPPLLPIFISIASDLQWTRSGKESTSISIQSILTYLATDKEDNGIMDTTTLACSRLIKLPQPLVTKLVNQNRLPSLQSTDRSDNASNTHSTAIVASLSSSSSTGTLASFSTANGIVQQLKALTRNLSVPVQSLLSSYADIIADTSILQLRQLQNLLQTMKRFDGRKSFDDSLTSLSPPPTGSSSLPPSTDIVHLLQAPRLTSLLVSTICQQAIQNVTQSIPFAIPLFQDLSIAVQNVLQTLTTTSSLSFILMDHTVPAYKGGSLANSSVSVISSIQEGSVSKSLLTIELLKALDTLVCGTMLTSKHEQLVGTHQGKSTMVPVLYEKEEGNKEDNLLQKLSLLSSSSYGTNTTHGGNSSGTNIIMNQNLRQSALYRYLPPPPSVLPSPSPSPSFSFSSSSSSPLDFITRLKQRITSLPYLSIPARDTIVRILMIASQYTATTAATFTRLSDSTPSGSGTTSSTDISILQLRLTLIALYILMNGTESLSRHPDILYPLLVHLWPSLLTLLPSPTFALESYTSIIQSFTYASGTGKMDDGSNTAVDYKGTGGGLAPSIHRTRTGTISLTSHNPTVMSSIRTSPSSSSSSSTLTKIKNNFMISTNDRIVETTRLYMKQRANALLLHRQQQQQQTSKDRAQRPGGFQSKQQIVQTLSLIPNSALSNDSSSGRTSNALVQEISPDSPEYVRLRLQQVLHQLQYEEKDYSFSSNGNSTSSDDSSITLTADTESSRNNYMLITHTLVLELICHLACPPETLGIADPTISSSGGNSGGGSNDTFVTSVDVRGICAGDFLRSRFMMDVWPRYRAILFRLIGYLYGNTTTHTNTSGTIDHSSHVSLPTLRKPLTSLETLFITALRGLRRLCNPLVTIQRENNNDTDAEEISEETEEEGKNGTNRTTTSTSTRKAAVGANGYVPAVPYATANLPVQGEGVMNTFQSSLSVSSGSSPIVTRFSVGTSLLRPLVYECCVLTVRMVSYIYDLHSTLTGTSSSLPLTMHRSPLRTSLSIHPLIRQEIALTYSAFEQLDAHSIWLAKREVLRMN